MIHLPLSEGPKLHGSSSIDCSVTGEAEAYLVRLNNFPKGHSGFCPQTTARTWACICEGESSLQAGSSEFSLPRCQPSGVWVESWIPLYQFAKELLTMLIFYEGGMGIMKFDFFFCQEN